LNPDQHRNCFSLIWITEGNGRVKVDFTEYAFNKNYLFSFSPNQPFQFLTEKIKGIAIYFHPDFFCIHNQQTEAACLFNNIQLLPYILVDEKYAAQYDLLTGLMKDEIKTAAIAHYEILVSYLRILLVITSRVKTEQQPETLSFVPDNKDPFILQTLKDRIEKDFRKKHSAGDYARSLNISVKTLAKITSHHFNKTLTELISERIIMEAKRELYMTKKPVKEIAYELGYEDEHYFSRFFKSNVDISPQIYRKTIGFSRSIY
jgi:AraC-like DNA-binding protein